jgi:lysozyme family protein
MNIIDRILLEEGGYVNDPHDAGGETKYGISKRAHPDEDIKNLTKERARELLERDYIEKPGFGALTPGAVRDQLIDIGYHSGPATAVRLLQAVLGVPIDGILGPNTRATLGSSDPLKINNLLVQKRVLFLADIVADKPQNLKFLRGWMKRALSHLVV